MENLFKSENTLIKVLTYTVTIIIALIVFNFIYKKIMSNELFANSATFGVDKIVFVGTYNKHSSGARCTDTLEYGSIAIVLKGVTNSINNIEIYANNNKIATLTGNNVKNGLVQVDNVDYIKNFFLNIVSISSIKLKVNLKNNLGGFEKVYNTQNIKNIFYKNKRCSLGRSFWSKSQIWKDNEERL